MVSNLLALYSVLTSEIEQATKVGNETRVNELNDKIVDLWEQILAYQPENAADSKLLSDFLLDQSLKNPNNRGDNQLINLKILELYAYKPPDQ